MALTNIALGMLLLAAPLHAQHAESEPAQQPAPQAVQDAASFDLAKVKIAGCAGERFDFVLGEPSAGTKVSLCSNAGASKDEIAAMLESAIRELESTDRIGAGKRDSIVAQIRGKIAEVRAR